MEISKEVYEAVKAQVLEEQKEERRERQKQRNEIREKAFELFKETRDKYYLPLVEKYEHEKFAKGYTSDVIERWYEEAEKMALYKLKERNRETAYLHGKKEEANLIAAQILETMIRSKINQL